MALILAYLVTTSWPYYLRIAAVVAWTMIWVDFLEFRLVCPTHLSTDI